MTPIRSVRCAVGVAVALVALLGPARPAGADPAQPTDYRSTVLDVEGEVPGGLVVEVVGGDAFLELTVPAGHTAVVPDTATGPDGDPRPYLRFAADGTVERNESSFSAAANETRYGTGDRDFDPDAPARWVEVANDGTYVWHDHRIHWMAGGAPSAVADDGRVDLGGPDGTWEVPLVVDGEPVTVRGELVLLSAPNPAGWVGLTALLVAAAVAVGLRTSRTGRPVPHRIVAGVGLVAALGAAVVGWAAWRDIPAAAGGNALPFVVPAAALGAAALATLGPARTRLVALGATAAALLGWGALRWDVLTHAVLPTDLAFTLDRAGTAVALGVGAGLALLLVWHPPTRRRPAAAPPAADVGPAATASPTA